ncbi:MAG: ribonuclease HI family protein [Pseudomonadota bacterium]
MYTDEQLIAAAYHGERVSSRRLAGAAGIGEMEALRRTLEQAAGPAGLAALLFTRAAAVQRDAERRAAKAQQQAARLALKQAGSTLPPGAWQAWFDGSAHPNPGKLGIGALLSGPDGEQIEISRRAGHGNSGEAEYLALIALLEAAVHARAPQLVIYGDSQVVINDVLHAGAPGAKGLEMHRTRALQLMAQLADVTLRWVPRHRNGAADRLSQQAIASWRAEMEAD